MMMQERHGDIGYTHGFGGVRLIIRTSPWLLLLPFKCMIPVSVNLDDRCVYFLCHFFSLTFFLSV